MHLSRNDVPYPEEMTGSHPTCPWRKLLTWRLHGYSNTFPCFPGTSLLIWPWPHFHLKHPGTNFNHQRCPLLKPKYYLIFAWKNKGCSTRFKGFLLWKKNWNHFFKKRFKGFFLWTRIRVCGRSCFSKYFSLWNESK